MVDEIIDLLPDCDIHVIARTDTQPAVFQRPDPEELMRKMPRSRRGDAHLRLYLGYAAGCGTTTAMLDEARRRSSRGTDVLVAAGLIRGASAGNELELLSSADATADRLDVEAVLKRNPEVVCIDDLSAPDTEGRQRHESVDRFIEAGITVIATLRLTDLASVRANFADVLRERQLGPTLDDAVSCTWRRRSSWSTSPPRSS